VRNAGATAWPGLLEGVDRREHLFLSPHFDDAVGSCGGTMWRLGRAGHTVRMLTLFGGEPNLPLSSLASRFHAAAGGLHAVAARRAEDAAACRILRSAGEHLDHLDAIYRRDDAGDHLYPKRASITAPVATADLRLIEPMATAVVARLRSSGTVVYCPMAIGGHVDHVLARDCGLRLTDLGVEVIFYADFYYSASASRIGSAEAREWHVHLTPSEFLRKLRAFSKYRSQIQLLFGRRLRFVAHFCRHGWVERFQASEAFAQSARPSARRSAAPSKSTDG
jgi:LmbE family N-acetylglucosaminyl deacetylase